MNLCQLLVSGTVWASAVGASLAYNSKRSSLKPSLRLIHARYYTVSELFDFEFKLEYAYTAGNKFSLDQSLNGCCLGFRIHAQALTLAVLCGAAIKHYYDVEN